MLDERAFARHIAFVHRPNLWDRDVGFVNDKNEILGEIIKQATRGASAWTIVEMERVVLDSGTGSNLFQHFQVVCGAHSQPLRLK